MLTPCSKCKRLKYWDDHVCHEYLSARVEHRVISTVATGAPLGPGETHAEQLQSGLDAMAHDGWILLHVIGTTLLVFGRDKR